LRRQHLEVPGVHVPVVETQGVARRTTHQQLTVRVVQRATEPADVAVDLVDRAARRIVAPDVVDELGDRATLARPYDEGGEQAAPLRGTEALPFVAIPDLQRPENPQPHPSLRSCAADYEIRHIIERWTKLLARLGAHPA
jgi:hypothetical protein